MRLSKRDEAAKLYRDGCVKAALKLSRKFDAVFSAESVGTLQIAYECLAGGSKFYASLGVDVDNTIQNAKNIMYEYCRNRDIPK
jgi:hypothetical protein